MPRQKGPYRRNGLWVGYDIVGGLQSHQNFLAIGEKHVSIDAVDAVLRADIAELRTDLDFVRGVDGITWDDFSVPLTRDKQGQSSKPDYDFVNNGLLFPYDDDTEIVYLTAQMLHQKKLDTPIELHVHYIQTSADQPIWLLDYRWYNNGAAADGGWTTLSTDDVGGNRGLFAYTAGNILQIAEFPQIAAIANENVSSNLDLRFYRHAHTVPAPEVPAADVLAKYIDFHYQVDSLGSDDEYVKQS